MKLHAAFGGFSVNDLKNAKDFYENIVGLELESDAMGLTFKLPSGGNIFIYEKPDHQPAAYTTFNLVVGDIDAAVDELTQKGVVFEIYDEIFPGANQDEKGILHTSDPAKDGPSIAWFKDPADNIVAILEDTN